MTSRKYRIRVPGNLLWRKHKHCFYEVSVGQEYHEGNKLKATLRWLGLNFTSVHIMLGDTVHRHNLMFEECLSEDEAWRRCRGIGDDWLVRNSEFIQSMTIPVTISRWDDWLKDSRYQSTISTIKRIYDQHPEVRDAVRVDGQRYIDSCLRRGIEIADLEFARRKCDDLILEENAGFSIILEDHGPIDCYPGCELTSSELIRTSHIAEVPPGLKSRLFTRIKFKPIGSTLGTNENVESDSLEDRLEDAI